MATVKRKASAKKAPKTARKKAAKRKLPKPRPCVPPEICAYLADLTLWLEWFYEDYQALRSAMCNVEQEAFTGTGMPGKRFPACGGGVRGDPIPPPRPPVWE